MTTARYRMDENDLDPENECDCPCHDDPSSDGDCGHCDDCRLREPYDRDVPEDDDDVERV